MPKIFADQDVGYGDEIVFTTPGRYSMDAAVEILQWLENRDGCESLNPGWKSAGYGDLVENGLRVRLGNIELSIMCSYSDIFISRLSGNKMRFHTFCESIRDLDFASCGFAKRKWVKDNG
ncbi:MAG: hypothetical protein JXB07_12005 [Anaerolineae bacterium]|nr:hypothetical protein [Anaerolineae bacterium]